MICPKCEIDKLEKAIKRAREMKINSQSNEKVNSIKFKVKSGEEVEFKARR